MTDRHEVSRLTVRLCAEDRHWLSEFAKETDISVAKLVIHAVQHLRNWEEKGRKAAEEILACIDDVFREHEEQLRRQRNYYERRIRAERIMAARRRPMQPALGLYGNARHRPKVAKLLALAVSSNSDGEAAAAFAKARELYRRAA